MTLSVTNSTDLENNINELRLVFEALSIYRQALSDKILNKLYILIDYIYKGNSELCEFINKYNSFYNALTHVEASNSLTNYIIDYIIFNENVFSRKAEFMGIDELESSFRLSVERELNYLQRIANITSSQ